MFHLGYLLCVRYQLLRIPFRDMLLSEQLALLQLLEVIPMYLTAEYQEEQKGINLNVSKWQPDERTYKDNRRRVVEPSTMWFITKHTAHETTFIGVCSTQEEALNVIRLCGVRGLTTDFGLQVQDDYIRRGPFVARLLPLLSSEVIEALTQSPIN